MSIFLYAFLLLAEPHMFAALPFHFTATITYEVFCCLYYIDCFPYIDLFHVRLFDIHSIT